MSQNTHNNVSESGEIASVEFCTYVKVKIIWEKNAYLLKEISGDVKNLSEDHNTMPFISYTKSLRQYSEKNFKDQIGFFNLERQVIVYSAETKPCQHVASTLQGFGLPDRDLVKAFSTFVR